MILILKSTFVCVSYRTYLDQIWQLGEGGFRVIIVNTLVRFLHTEVDNCISMFKKDYMNTI